MLQKRVVVCLDVRDGKTVKSVKFVDTKELGDPVEMAQEYYRQGVDELDDEKLTPLLLMRYKNAISDAVADLGPAGQIRKVFVGFQKYLYEARPV